MKEFKAITFSHAMQSGGSVDEFEINEGKILITSQAQLDRLKATGAYQKGLISEFDPSARQRQAERDAQAEKDAIKNANPISSMFEGSELANMNTYLIPGDYENIRANIIDVLDFRMGQVRVEEAGKIAKEGLQKPNKDTAPSKTESESVKAEDFDKLYNATHTESPPPRNPTAPETREAERYDELRSDPARNPETHNPANLASDTKGIAEQQKSPTTGDEAAKEKVEKETGTFGVGHFDKDAKNANTGAREHGVTVNHGKEKSSPKTPATKTVNKQTKK